MSIFFFGFIFIQHFFLKSIVIKFLSIILTLISSISGLIALILNPGIVYNLKKEGKVCKNKIFCYQCKFEYPFLGQNISHCGECGVCYIGMDHHCDVFGKCIAKNNMNIFTIFLTSFDDLLNVFYYHYKALTLMKHYIFLDGYLY
jgi:hypothetical protein